MNYTAYSEIQWEKSAAQAVNEPVIGQQVRNGHGYAANTALVHNLVPQFEAAESSWRKAILVWFYLFD